MELLLYSKDTQEQSFLEQLFRSVIASMGSLPPSSDYYITTLVMTNVMLGSILSSIWGCIPELANNCQDMTNSSSTYFSIIVGAIIGGIISWWIYYRQKKTSEKQDVTLQRIEELNERHDLILSRIEAVEKRHQDTLYNIERLNTQIEKILDKSSNVK